MPDPDPLDMQPSEAEIKAAAEREARDARADAKKAAPAKAAGRGPGRPPGAKNKTTAAREAAARASGTTTTATAPRGLPPARTGPAADADAAARDRKKAERERRVAQLVAEADRHTFTVVSAVGMATGLPGHYLMQPAMDAAGNAILEQGQPAMALTPYGQALVPKPWQLKTCVEAYVRAEETDAGQKMLAQLDRAMPYVLMLGAVAALGTYTITTMQAAGAIREMIAAEIAQQNGEVPPQTPPASGGAEG